MKCAIVSAFGEVDDVVRVVEDFPKAKIQPGSNKVLIRVLACSTSPGDFRTLHGDADVVRKPKFPYIPSGDVCGIVEEIDGDCAEFKIGDCVVGTWKMHPYGGMAEYVAVDKQLVVKKPGIITATEAAALANSAVNAMLAVRDAEIKKRERVLVLGGSGGVGTIVVQLLKDIGASYIASVTTDTTLMESLGVDRNIDYSKESWWDVKEFQDDKFDAVIDCGQGRNAWKKCKSVLKTGTNGGRFLAVILIDPGVALHSWKDVITVFAGRAYWPQIWSSIRSSSLPRFKAFLDMAPRGNSSAELFKLVEEGRVEAVLNAKSPFPFTTEGVREAYRLQATTHAHGKIVVQLASNAQE